MGQGPSMVAGWRVKLLVGEGLVLEVAANQGMRVCYCTSIHTSRNSSICLKSLAAFLLQPMSLSRCNCID